MSDVFASEFVFLTKLIKLDILFLTVLRAALVAILFFKVLINLSEIIDFPSLCAEYVLYHYLVIMISLVCCKVGYLYPAIFCLVCD